MDYKKAWKNDSFYPLKAMLSGCKSYRFSSWKLSLYTVKAMLSQKKRVQNAVSGRPLIAFYASFSPILRFFVDMILIKQWQKCPIEAFFLEHEVFPQRAQMDTDFYLRTRTKGRWPKGKAITRIKRIFSHRYTQIFLEQRIKPDCTDYFFTGIIRNWPYARHFFVRQSIT